MVFPFRVIVAVLLVLGAGMALFFTVAHPNGHAIGDVRGSAWGAIHVLGALATSLAGMGVTVLIAREPGAAGWYGLSGWLLASVGAWALGGTMFASGTVDPLLAAHSPHGFSELRGTGAAGGAMSTGLPASIAVLGDFAFAIGHAAVGLALILRRNAVLLGGLVASGGIGWGIAYLLGPVVAVVGGALFVAAQLAIATDLVRRHVPPGTDGD